MKKSKQMHCKPLTFKGTADFRFRRELAMRAMWCPLILVQTVVSQQSAFRNVAESEMIAAF